MTRKRPIDRYESYEVYDERGRSVGRVVLPRRRNALGRGGDTVLLRRPPIPVSDSTRPAA